MRRYIPFLVGVMAAVALVVVGLAAAGPPPNPPHDLHNTKCNTTVGDTTTAYASWGENVTMVLSPGNADNLWIVTPASLAGHYRIYGYQSAEGTSTSTPPTFPGWGYIGTRTGQDYRIECKGYFPGTTPNTYSWVDSIEVRVD